MADELRQRWAEAAGVPVQPLAEELQQSGEFHGEIRRLSARTQDHRLNLRRCRARPPLQTRHGVRYELPIKRASGTQQSPIGMIIHAVMAAARRREGKLRPIARVRTLAAASTECPILAVVIQPSPRWGVSQLPIRTAKSSATISSPDQRNARTDGSQMVHGRQAPPARAAGLTFTRPVCSSQRGWNLSCAGRIWPR